MTALCCHCERSDAISCRPRWSTEMPQPGPRNLITDVPGVLVGQAEDVAGITGASVVLCEAPAVAAVDMRGGAPGSRETELLRSATLVERVDGAMVGALVAVNSWGSAGRPDCGRLWAAELALPGEIDPQPSVLDTALDAEDFSACAAPLPGGNTTIAVVATDAPLDKSGC